MHGVSVPELDSGDNRQLLGGMQRYFKKRIDLIEIVAFHVIFFTYRNACLKEHLTFVYMTKMNYCHWLLGSWEIEFSLLIFFDIMFFYLYVVSLSSSTYSRPTAGDRSPLSESLGQNPLCWPNAGREFHTFTKGCEPSNSRFHHDDFPHH